MRLDFRGRERLDAGGGGAGGGFVREEEGESPAEVGADAVGRAKAFRLTGRDEGDDFAGSGSSGGVFEVASGVWDWWRACENG